mgnify:CR=1 FL=1
MRFMMLMFPRGYEVSEPDGKSKAEAMAAMGRYNDSLRKAGVLLTVDGLHSPAAGTRVRFSGGGKPKVTDGPFTEAKEVLGGFWMLEVKSKEEAVAWASRCPAGDGEFIEVRQVHEFDDFPPEFREAVRLAAAKAAP